MKRSVSEFTRTLAEAVAIVLLVSFLSLGLRTGLIVALSIPLTFAVTFLFMHQAGIDLHKVSLGALIIALGLLVDDAIISVEMMVVKMEQGWERVRAASFAYTSTAMPMLTGTVVTAAGFLPIGLARSSTGEYTFAMFAVTTIALLVSWVVSVLFVPYLGYKLLPDFHRPGAPVDEGAIYRKPFYLRFRRLVNWSVAHRWTVIGATLAAFALSVFAFRFVQQQFFPPANRPELIVDLRLAEGVVDHRDAGAGGEARAAADDRARAQGQHRELRELRGQRQPALLPAARPAARQRELRPVRGEHEGQRGARGGARAPARALRRGLPRAARARDRGWRTARPWASPCSSA